LRNVLGALRPNGLAVFYECNLLPGFASFPESGLHQLVTRCVRETFAAGGVEVAMGWKLYQTFIDAGLPPPQLHANRLIIAGSEQMERFAPYVANLLRSLMPRWGEAVQAVVVVQPTSTETELIEYCRERIAHYKAPKVRRLVGVVASQRLGEGLEA
jgi:acyl-CoA synthetase (AMP-forming)/AMP-acid ligase II